MTRHQVETELSDIRREITRLQRREAQLRNGTEAQETCHARPGWPMRRVDETVVQPFGLRISTSESARTAV